VGGSGLESSLGSGFMSLPEPLPLLLAGGIAGGATAAAELLLSDPEGEESELGCGVPSPELEESLG
jgi:hypothetical protein